MALELIIRDSKLLFIYTNLEAEIGEPDWIDDYFEDNDDLYFKTLYLSKDRLVFSEESKCFIIGEIKEDLIYLDKTVFDINHDFCIDVSFPLEFKYFSYTSSGMRGSHIPFIRKISKVIDKKIIISDNERYEEAIPINKYINFIEKFPSARELSLYANKRIEEQIGSFLDIDNSHIIKYEKYLNKIKSEQKDLTITIDEYELKKYRTLIDELKYLLQTNILSENEWQKRIIKIILLIYPNYIYVLEKVKINTEDGDKEIDLCLVNSNGCIDVIEIKRPFTSGIISEGTYRNNYYPLKELSGSLMQTEKYLFYLNRAGYIFEQKLNDRYKEELNGLRLKIRNPKGIIIAGNSINFTKEQKDDFEIIKKKYSNILDIITYNDLINRLENIVKFLSHR